MKAQKKTKKDGGVPHTGQNASPMLPPCRICGEKASGFHYGVNTCEACKAFFRRNLEKGSLYKCIEEGKCEILPGKRNSCAACRFNKCISLGMCKEAIKTGRYTHEKKAEDIKEVKRLESSVAESKSPPESSKATEQISQSASLKIFDTMSPASSTFIISEELSPMYLQPRSSPGSSQHMSPASSHSLLSPASSQHQPSPKVVSSSTTIGDDELQKITDAIVTSYNATTTYTEEFFSLIPEREQKYLEQKMLKRQMFGPMNPLPDDEYARILQVTGLDADGRKEMFQSEIPHIEQSIKRFVAFAKSIPGFGRLCMDDQICVIKNRKFEAWMIISHRAFNPIHNLYATLSGRIIGIDEMVKLNDIEFIESIFQLQARIHRLMLTQEETCILGAFAIMLTDDCVVRDTTIVEESQELLMKCLFYLFQKNGHNPTMRFAKVVSCLLQLRTTKKLHSIAEEQMLKTWVGKIEFPPLLFEMWSS